MATVTFYGNLGQEAKTKVIESNGTVMTHMSVAENIGYMDKGTNEWVEVRTDWHAVMVFSPLVQEYAKSLKAGTRVKVTGSLSYNVVGENEQGHDILSATIIAERIELAPLVKKTVEPLSTEADSAHTNH